MTINGYTQSQARVSTLMRNLEASQHLDHANLVEIKAVPQGAHTHQRVHAQRVKSRDRKQKTTTGKGAKTASAGGTMTFDDLKRLDPKKIGSWPALPKIGVLLLVLALLIMGLVLVRLERSVRADRRGESKRSAAAHDLRRQEEAGARPRRLPQTARRHREGVRHVVETAAEQVRNGSAAHGHQPGRSRTRPAIRVVQTGGH